MSRIGQTPIKIPTGASVELSGSSVILRGPKGELRLDLPNNISLKNDSGVITVICANESTKKDQAIYGFIRAQLANYLAGVTVGWTKTLELVGVGYRAAVNGQNLVLNIGFSHPVTIEPPQGVQFSIVDGKIVISGIDKQLVGQVAAKVRAIRSPEPYKGKGIRYQGEYVRRKAGKSAKSVGGAPGGK